MQDDKMYIDYNIDIDIHTRCFLKDAVWQNSLLILFFLAAITIYANIK